MLEVAWCRGEVLEVSVPRSGTVNLVGGGMQPCRLVVKTWFYTCAMLAVPELGRGRSGTGVAAGGASLAALGGCCEPGAHCQLCDLAWRVVANVAHAVGCCYNRCGHPNGVFLFLNDLCYLLSTRTLVQQFNRPFNLEPFEQ